MGHFLSHLYLQYTFLKDCLILRWLTLSILYFNCYVWFFLLLLLWYSLRYLIPCHHNKVFPVNEIPVKGKSYWFKPNKDYWFLLTLFPDLRVDSWQRLKRKNGREKKAKFNFHTEYWTQTIVSKLRQLLRLKGLRERNPSLLCFDFLLKSHNWIIERAMMMIVRGFLSKGLQLTFSRFEATGD